MSYHAAHLRICLRALAAAAVTALVGLTPAVEPASAGSVPPSAIELAATGAHESFIRIDDRGEGIVRKNLKIGQGKSVLIEFPRDVRDVMVSNPATVDAVVLSSNRVFLLGKEQGEANAFIFDSNGEQLATMEIYVDRDVSGLKALLARVIPNSNIEVEFLNQTVILKGSVRNPSDSVQAAKIAAQFLTQKIVTSASNGKDGSYVSAATQVEPKDSVINLLAVEAEEQVMLKVTVAEVNRSVLKQMGVNLGAAINAGNFSTTLLTDNALPLTAAAGLGALPRIALGTQALDPDTGPTCETAGAMCGWNAGPDNNTFSNSGFVGAGQFGSTRITHAIRALEREGLVRTLAEPTLTAVNGEPAKFLAGGEFPVPMADNLGAISVAFKEFGVGLAFTPIVMSEGRISLKIETEVSELSSAAGISVGGVSIPGLKKREAKSTVELPSGGTLALAGLMSDDVRQNMDGLPGAKDIPILGTLFRSRDYIKNETELVVIVTPYLVHATSRQQIASPTDGLAPATDMKANFLGHLHRVYGKGEAMPEGGLKGDYGFIVE